MNFNHEPVLLKETIEALNIKENGISNYYFSGQDEDKFSQDFLEIATTLTLNYTVETEKNRVIFRENMNNIRIRGEAVNIDGTPINATGVNTTKQ